MMTRSDKDTVIKSVRDCIDRSQALFLTNLIGISSNDAVSIRKGIREAEGKVVIARNTLLQKAAAGTKVEKLFSGIKGPHAVAFAFDNPPAVAKVLYEAGKEFEAVSLKGGILGEQELQPAEVEALAKLPSREEMLGTLLATFNAPISAFARVLNAIKDKNTEGEATN